MVRNIVGSLLIVGQGDKPVEWMADLMALKDRNQAGPTAAADGLYLVKVSYPQSAGVDFPVYLPRFY